MWWRQAGVREYGACCWSEPLKLYCLCSEYFAHISGNISETIIRNGGLKKLGARQTYPTPDDVTGIAKRLTKALVIGLGLWLVWTQLLYPTNAVRYRLTIDVDTPQGIRSNSSVIEARFGFEPTLFGLISGIKSSLAGEAVFVDLGSGKNIVVTLTNTGSGRTSSDLAPEMWALNAKTLPLIVFDIPSHNRQKTPKAILNAKSAGQAEVPVARLPLVVTFKDPADPWSAIPVDPTNLDAVFGSGYSISRATIEITDDTLAWRLKRHLHWHRNLDAKTKCGSKTGVSRIICSGALG